MSKILTSLSVVPIFAASLMAFGQATSFQGPQVTSQATVQDCCATVAQQVVSGTSVSLTAPPFNGNLTDFESAHIGTAKASANANVVGASNNGVTLTAQAFANATPPPAGFEYIGSLHSDVGQGGTYYQFTLAQPSYVEMDASFTPAYTGPFSDRFGGYTGSASLHSDSPGGTIAQGNNPNNSYVYFAISDTSGNASNNPVTLDTGAVLLPAGTYYLIGAVNASADAGQTTSVQLKVSITISPALPLPPIGSVTCAQGSSTLSSSGGAAQNVTVGMPIHMGDTISSGPNGLVCIQMNDGTTWGLSGSTTLNVNEYLFDPINSDGELEFGITHGLFTYTTGQLGQQSNHEILFHTPFGTVAVKGTEFIGDVEDQNATLYLDSGEVTVTPSNQAVEGDYLAQTVIKFDANGAATSAFSQSDYDALKQQITGSTPDTTPPTITCGVAPTGWQSMNITIACSASDLGSGLANAMDASFTLATSVALGAETANASTNSHDVCDKAGNCATAEPIGGIMIDRKPPAITISVPASNSTYLINASASASYQCQDGGSGVQSCSGPVANGAKVDTSSVGAHTFSVNALDNVGNSSSSSSSYSVSYGVCLLFDNTRSVKSGSTVPIRIALCDSSGNDVSSSAVIVQALSLTQISSSASMTLENAGSSNPDNNFRFDSTQGTTGGYVFNLQTTGLTTGTYALAFVAGSDPTMHTVTFQVR